MLRGVDRLAVHIPCLAAVGTLVSWTILTMQLPLLVPPLAPIGMHYSGAADAVQLVMREPPFVTFAAGDGRPVFAMQFSIAAVLIPAILMSYFLRVCQFLLILVFQVYSLGVCGFC